MSDKNLIEPLEGETFIPGVTTKRASRTNVRQVVAIAVLIFSIIAIIGFTLVRRFTKSPSEVVEKTVAPEVASTRARKLDMTQLPKAASEPSRAAAPASATGTRVAEIDPDVTPIPLRGAGASNGGQPRKVMSPDDAPIFSAGATPDIRTADKGQAQQAAAGTEGKPGSALEDYRRQAAPLLQQLQRLSGGGAVTTPLTSPSVGGAIGGATQPATGTTGSPSLFGSMDRSATPTVQARLLGDRSLVMPKGTLFTCSLKTRIITATSGLVGCQVIRNVFSDDGHVLLVERGSHLDGEYRVVQVKPGLTRIPVLWTRVRTPTGVTVDLDSPATGSLGESGIGGYVDNRWTERIGGALLLSLVEDVVKLAVGAQSSGGNTGNNNTLVLPNTTAQGSKLAEKVLEATINIPPLLYQNQGGVVGVYVARDIDFSSVYELRPQ
jgi:type IV secretion system protein VirB10